MGNSLHSAPGDENRLPGLTVGNDGGLPLEKMDDHHAPLQRAAAVEAGLKEAGSLGGCHFLVMRSETSPRISLILFSSRFHKMGMLTPHHRAGVRIK